MRKSRERLEDYSRGDKVFYNVEEVLYNILDPW